MRGKRNINLDPNSHHSMGNSLKVHGGGMDQASFEKILGINVDHNP
jgi:hypothetical protein